VGAADDEAGGAMMPPKNPYDFVRLEDKASETVAPNFNRATNHSGIIEYTLHTLTPTVVNQVPPSNRAGIFARLGRQSVIPATSLKGMLRGVHEVVTNSNFGMLSRDAFWLQSVPPSYKMERSQQPPTPTEAMFGTARDDTTLQTGAGRVLLSDIAVPGEITLSMLHIPRPRGGPKPAHRSFYFTNENRILGRKFYYHQDFNEPAPSNETTTVEALPIGRTLSGTLRFIDLTDEELALLVYTLVLEWHEQDAQGHRLAHKLGYGKPLGLGSVRCTIQHLYVETRNQAGIPNRFLQYETNTYDDWAEQIEQYRKQVQHTWTSRNAESYADFVAVTRWQHTEPFHYPSKSWFDTNKSVPLWKRQGRQSHEMYPGDDSSTVPVLPFIQTEHHSPPQRRSGMLGTGSQGGYAVYDGNEELNVHTAGASGKLIKKHLKRLQAGERIAVSYRREEGNTGAMASDLREEQS
jgi:hypothetical protein